MSDAQPTALPSLSAAGSGYLARLARRARGEDERLQRRRPALFEPVAPWRGDEASESVASLPKSPARREITEASPGSDARSVPAVYPEPGLRAAALEAAADAVLDADARPGKAVARSESDPRRIDASILPPREEARHESTVVVARVAVASVNVPAAPPPVAGHPHRVETVPHPASSTSAPVPPLAAATAARHAPAYPFNAAPPDAAAPPRQSGEAASTASARHTTGSPVAPTAATGDAARGRVAALARVAVQTPEQIHPSPIEVTIGRVEIRAVPAPAPSPRPARTGPRLSLDDYLRHRSRGDTS